MSQIFKILSLLLSYPEQELIEARDELYSLLKNKEKKMLANFFDWMQKNDLQKIQEHYVELFDRSRSLSLHLFEHIHGDSNKRGEAMVDLNKYYHRYGFIVASQELPDYLPLFLEFLSLRPYREGRALLGDPINILEVLKQRLQKRKSPYADLFKLLVHLASGYLNFALVNKAIVQDDGKPPSLEALDKIWEEEKVTFMGNKSPCKCGGEASQCSLMTKGSSHE